MSNMEPEGQEPGTEAELEAPSRPDWLPENFKDEKAFVESYQHAQRKIGEQGNELSQMREEMDALVEQMQTPQYQQQPGSPADHPLVAAYARAMEDGDYGNAALIQAQITREVQKAEQALEAKNAPEEDFGSIADLAEISARKQWGDERYQELEAAATEILNANPHLVPDGSLAGVKKGLNTALELAERQMLASEHQTLAEKQAKIEEGRQRKLAAQTVSGSGPRPAPPDEQKQTWEAIRNAGQGRFSTS